MLLRLRPGDIGRLFSEGIEPDPAPAPAARRLRREAAFRENLTVRARRLIGVLGSLVRSRRVVDLTATLDLLLRDRLGGSARAPNPSAALVSAEGLAGLAFDLSPPAMMEAYGKGLSPSASLGPIAWHSRPIRFVASPADLAAPFDLESEAPDCLWATSFDRNVDWVLSSSWRFPGSPAIMPPRLLSAFADLFDAGFAHCFDVRNELGEAIGGGFGVAIGRVFVLESAFEIVDGAARFGLAQLAKRIGDQHFAIVERAPGAAWLGDGLFQETPREDYLAAVARYGGAEQIGRWRNDEVGGAPPALDDGRIAA
jgi:leucyl/phenylalanyl-tRNA---protein transferase